MTLKSTGNFSASVLLVDDEQDFLDLLGERLENRGMQVTTAISGQAALTKLSHQDFDIIVIDLSMPGMDGIETIRRIKAERPETETIMLTGHATLQSGIEAMKCGAGDYLEKPADIELLLNMIHKAQYRRMKALEKNSRDDVQRILKTRGW